MRLCRFCGSDELSWQAWNVLQRPYIAGSAGRTVFFLGCDECSETLIPSVSAEDVAEALNHYGWRPGDAD